MNGDTRVLTSLNSISAMLSSCSGFGHVNLHEALCDNQPVCCVCTGRGTHDDISLKALSWSSYTSPSRQNSAYHHRSDDVVV